MMCFAGEDYRLCGQLLVLHGKQYRSSSWLATRVLLSDLKFPSVAKTSTGKSKEGRTSLPGCAANH